MQDQHQLKEVFHKLKEDSDYFYGESMASFIRYQLIRSAKHYGGLRVVRIDPRSALDEGMPLEDPIQDVQTQCHINLLELMKGEIDISFEDFENICRVLNVNLIAALKYFVSLAESIKESQTRSESGPEWFDRITREAAEEIEYQKWQQRRKEL